MSASPSQFPTAGGALVPRSVEDPPELLKQERQEEVMNAPRLLKFLNRTLDAIAGLDQNEQLKIHNQMIKNVAYYDGRWDGECKNGVWVDNEAVAGEITPKDNEYKKQVDKLQMEMCRTRIKYESEAINRYSAESREAAEFAQHRIEVNQERIEIEPFVQAENMSLAVKGTAFRYTFFDRNADSREKRVEIQVLNHLTGGAKVSVCRTCGKSVDTAPCPYCGDTETKEIAAPESEGFKIDIGHKSAGRVVTVRPDATMVELDLNARDILGSNFVRWRLALRRCDWEAFFPNTRIPSGDETDEGRRRRDQQNNPSNSGWGESSGDNGGDQFEMIEGELVWLDPKVYQRYRNKEDEVLANGQHLPKGTVLVDRGQYPQGMCVARIGQKILDIYPSNKNKCWTMCVYGLREHALHGSGTNALLGPQDTINDLNGFVVAHIYYAAAGREFTRSDGIEGGQLPAYNQVAVVNAPAEVGDIANWAYARSQPAALAPDVYAFRESQRGSLQDAAGTSSLSTQGAADMKALGTATGVEASRDQAVGRMIPNRKLQAFAGTEWCKQVLELEQENYEPEVFLQMAGKSDEKGSVQYTERGVKAFFNSDVRNDLKVQPAEGSWIPETAAQKAAKAATFAQMAGQLKGDPQLLSLVAPSVGVDYSIDEWGAAQRNASMRLEEYARVSKIVSDGGYAPNPEMVEVVLSNVAEWARVNAGMDNHQAFRDFYEDWWLSDEGRNANSLLRLVVETVHSQHLNKGIVVQAQEQGAAEIASQAPQQAVQEQLSNEQKAQQAQEMAATEAAGKEEVVQEALGRQMLAEKDREHQAQVEMQKREHATQMEIGKMAYDAALNDEETNEDA